MIIITIPAYNEEASIGRVIDEIKKVMSEGNHKYKILVVDDGSKDNTVKIAKFKGAIVYSHPRNLGLAETFKTEIEQALKLKADIVVHTDADGQYPAEFIPLLLKKIEEGYDIILGSRFRLRNKMPLLKKLGNIAFAKVFTNITRVKITDTTTGFRVFTKEVAKEIKIISTFTYTQEQIIKAAKLKFRIAEVPIRTRPTRESRLFKNPFEYAVKAWINIFRIYRDFDPLKFFGRIGLYLIGLGFIIGAWLIYLFITTGRIGHTPSAILSVLLIITGIQTILFGFLADMKRV